MVSLTLDVRIRGAELIALLMGGVVELCQGGLFVFASTYRPLQSARLVCTSGMLNCRLCTASVLLGGTLPHNLDMLCSVSHVGVVF